MPDQKKVTLSLFTWHVQRFCDAIGYMSSSLLPAFGVLWRLVLTVALLLLSLLLYRASVVTKDFRAVEISAGAGLAQTFDNLNRPCGVPEDGDIQRHLFSGDAPSDEGMHIIRFPVKPCGLIEKARTVLNSSNGLLEQSGAIEREQGKLLTKTAPQLVYQLYGSLAHLDDATEQVNDLALSARRRVDALEPIETNAAQFVSHLDTETEATFGNVNVTVSNANRLIVDPEIPQILVHANGILASGDSMMATGDAILKKSSHSYLHPSTNPFVRTFQNVQPYALFGARIAAATAVAW